MTAKQEEQGTMKFGSWVQAMREKREMDIRAFAHTVRVHASTISRIEQARSQVTLWTAVRICEGVEATPADLLAALQGKRPAWATGYQRKRVVEVITINDLEALLFFLQHHWKEGCLWLTGLLNHIAASTEVGQAAPKDQAVLIVPEDIEKLLQDSRLYQFKIHYPEDMKAETLWQMYLQGGALSLVDIGMYIRQVRRTKRVTFSGLEEAGSLSASVLSRLETGALERVKLDDVLTLDAQLGQEGKLVAMYWRACLLMERIEQAHQPEKQSGREIPASQDQREQQVRVVELFLSICRWLSCLYGSDTSWIKEFRRRFEQAAPEARVNVLEADSPSRMR
ncbi:MAG TPA: helix-turn-helix transcriptional regulator [Ktedonobacteraceae bacterium]|nr:helix-turn-helix transcriptional regulator [Ktedonobacteraceae bacterium]